MQQDDFTGQGGTYILDSNGGRSRVEEPTLGAVRSLYQAAKEGDSVGVDFPVDLAQVLAGTAAEVVAVLPHLSSTQLAEIAALEGAGKARKTVLDALAAIPVA